MGVPVRITLGRPPTWFRYEHEEVRMLAPPPRVFSIEDEREFRRAYEQHLNAVGVDRLRQVFERLAQQHGGQRLILLCFESRVEDCHRGQFARWWHERTGEAVPELPERKAAQERLF